MKVIICFSLFKIHWHKYYFILIIIQITFISKNVTGEKIHKCKRKECILAVLTKSVASTQNVVCFGEILLFQKILAVNFHLPDVNQLFFLVNWKRCFIYFFFFFNKSVRNLSKFHLQGSVNKFLKNVDGFFMWLFSAKEIMREII